MGTSPLGRTLVIANPAANRGEGAATDKRVGWSRQLTKQEAQQITLEQVFSINDVWTVGK